MSGRPRYLLSEICCPESSPSSGTLNAGAATTAGRAGCAITQRRPEAGARRGAAVAAADRVEDVPQRLGGDARAGTRDDHATRQPVAPRHHGELDDVTAGGVPARVLEQRVDGQAEP